MTSSYIFSQDYCIPNRFVDDYYFKSRDICVEKDIIYSKPPNNKGILVKLVMDIYYPKKSVDSLEYRPLIMLFHGGGFQRQDKEQSEKYCPLFAQRGFVTANINYRLGFIGEAGDSASLLAVYRAIQDAYSALQYLLHNSYKYGIDSNSIFVGGRSAGGVISLATAYMDQNNFNESYPWLSETLGDIDNTTNLNRKEYTIRGVINMWGVQSVESSISHLEIRKIPIIMFYGSKDMTYDKCIELAEYFKNNNGCYQLHTRIGAGHAEDMSKNYIVAKTGCFIKSIFCNECITLEREIDNQDNFCDNILPIDSLPIDRSCIKIDQSLLDQYVGQYSYVDENREKHKLIISPKGDHLLLQEEKSGFKTELFPESEKDFFDRDNNAQTSFYKNKNDKVLGMTIFMDAKERKVKKYK